MATLQELETLQIWLNQHASGYILATSNGEFTTIEAIQQLAESCDEIEIEDCRIDMTWTIRTSSPVKSKFSSVIAIPDVVNSRIGLEATPLTFEEFMRRSPGGLELCSGYLGSDIEDALTLLHISLETFGLLQVVRRAPRALWEAALNQTYTE